MGLFPISSSPQDDFKTYHTPSTAVQQKATAQEEEKQLQENTQDAFDWK